MQKLEEMRENPLFTSAYTYIIKNNKGENNPYHNNGHLYNVFVDVIKMCEYYDIKGIEEISMGLAALFHDFDHNGTIGQDNINIDNSIKGFHVWYSSLDESDKQSIDVDLVEKMIRTTEFPSRPDPETIKEQIMMDADMLSLYRNNWFDTTIVGLSKEFKVTLEKQIENQIKFVSNLKFFTDYATNLHNKFKEYMLRELTFLKSIFNKS